jgi:hypothetical protein
LTVPIPQHEIELKDIHIKNGDQKKGKSWNAEMARIIELNYKKTPFFEQYFPGLERALLTKREMLVDLSMDVIEELKKDFGLKTEIVIASKLPGYQKSGDPVLDLVNLTKIVEANVYLSGKKAQESYLKNPEPFTREGIQVEFQDYQHPVYQQRYWGFVPCMSAIDGLFNAGPGILKKVSKKEDNKQELQIQAA